MKNSKLLIVFSTLLTLVGCSNAISSTPTSTNSNNSTHSEVSVPNYEYRNATYSNPIKITNNGEIYNGGLSDPAFVIGDNGYYYMVCGNTLLKSEDCCNWEICLGSIIKDRPLWGNEIYGRDIWAGIWAPDLIKIKDKWILYYSLSAWDMPCGIGYATSDNIEGPYTDHGKFFDLNEIGVLNCIDPQPFIDDDGSIYMTVGSFQGNWLIELESDGLSCKNGIAYQKENKTLIAGQVSNWDGSQYEGGYIIKKDDYYYYFGSSGSCCEGKKSTYLVRVGRSKSIKGPYIDSNNRFLTMSGSGANYGNLVLWAGVNNPDYSGPGHNSIFLDEAGDYWIYYHGWSKLDDWGTRHIFMDKLLWDEKGFPYVENYKPSFQEEKPGPRFIITDK